MRRLGYGDHGQTRAAAEPAARHDPAAAGDPPPAAVQPRTCQFVDAELERNPLLEREEFEPPVAGLDEGGPGAEEPAAASAESWLDLANATDPTGTSDTEIEECFPDASSAEVTSDLGGLGWASRPRSGNFADEDPNLGRSSRARGDAERPSRAVRACAGLEGHVERLVGRHLIDLVDDAGYLTADLDQPAARLGAPAALVSDVLATLQTFDPPACSHGPWRRSPSS